MNTVLIILLGVGAFAVHHLTVDETTAQSRPNFVVIMVDDLDSGSVTHMPAVQRLLALNGATFTRFFASTPLCCPSRVSILRGQYAHNHGVLRNTGQDAGFAAFHASGHEAETVATMLDDAGYETALVGKYLNGYSIGREERTYIPPGWDYWVAGVDHAAYNGFNYDLNVNGEIVHHGRDDRDYMTDVLSAHALAFLDRAASANDPFLLYLAPYAAHSPSVPAPRHEGWFQGATAPRTPAFNERAMRDKPAWVRQTSRLSEERIARIDSDYRRRLESLLAVDEMVDVVVERLDETGMLPSTYILFLSDNGYFLGEHRQPHGKDAPYDAASRVPLIVRGPGIPANSSVSRLALNVDVSPTILALAGLGVPSYVDGRSLEPVMAGNDRGWREAVLLEGFGKETEYIEGSESSTPPFQALRTSDVLYVEYETGEREFYDLRKDPHQLSNLAQEASKTLLRQYSRHLKALASCAGSECRDIEDEPLPRRSGESQHRSDKGQKDDVRKRRQSTPTGDSQVAEASTNDPSLAVGGDDDAVALLRFGLTRREAKTDELRLHVHVASVEQSGTLITTLETNATVGDGDPARRNERLAGAQVAESGWVTLDISDALGDSNELTIGLRGRGGAALSISSAESSHPPELISGPPPNQADRDESRRNRRRSTRSQPDDRGSRPHESSKRGSSGR